METNIHGFIIIHQDNDEEKAKVNVIERYYEQLQSIMRQNKDDRAILSVKTPTTEDKVMLSSIITKDMAFLRGVDKDYGFCKSCELKDLVLPTSIENEKLFKTVKNQSVQFEYPRGILNVFIHELAEHNKSEFVQNKPLQQKYLKAEEKLRKAYGFDDVAERATQMIDRMKEAVSTSQEQLRKSSLLLELRPKVDKLAEIEQKFTDDPRCQFNNNLVTQKARLCSEIRQGICNFAVQEYRLKTPKEHTESSVQELFKSTRLDTSEYIRAVQNIYENNGKNMADATKITMPPNDIVR